MTTFGSRGGSVFVSHRWINLSDLWNLFHLLLAWRNFVLNRRVASNLRRYDAHVDVFLKKILFGHINTLRPRQNGRRFSDDIFKCIFFNENAWISIKISLKFVPKGPINKIPALVQIMAWHRSGDKPLSEPMMVSLLTHICVTRPQWVKVCSNILYGVGK